jgi:hypothetical protein
MKKLEIDSKIPPWKIKSHVLPEYLEELVFDLREFKIHVKGKLRIDKIEEIEKRHY